MTVQAFDQHEKCMRYFTFNFDTSRRVAGDTQSVD